MALLAAAGCGDEGASSTPPSPSSASGTPPGSTAASKPGRTLTFTRADGSRFELTAGPVRCEQSQTDKKRRVVIATSPVTSAGKPTYFSLEGIVDDVGAGTTITLPHDYVYDDAHGASLFATDGRTGNETSSQQEEGSGQLVFKHASCSPRPSLQVEVHAELGSEFFDGEVLTVDGTLDLKG